jgi:hypothetical protein
MDTYEVITNYMFVVSMVAYIFSEPIIELTRYVILTYSLHL